MLVRSNLSVQKLAEYKSTHASAYWFVYKQSDFTPIIYSVIYQPPGLTKDHKNNTTEHIISTASKHLQSYPKAKFVITGDFNDLNTTQVSTLLPLHHIVNFPTRGDAKLDLIYTDVDEYVTSGCLQLAPILTNDHTALLKFPLHVALRQTTNVKLHELIEWHGLRSCPHFTGQMYLTLKRQTRKLRNSMRL